MLKKLSLVLLITIIVCGAVLWYGPKLKIQQEAATAAASSSIITATDKWNYAIQSPTGSKDELDGISADAAGNIFVGGGFVNTVTFAGKKRTAKTGSDIFVSKLSPDGKELWFTPIDSGGEDLMWDLVADKNGDVIISGGYGGKLTLGGKTYNAYKDGSALWAKLDGKTGALKWIQTAGVPQEAAAKIDPTRVAGGNEISMDTKGNIIAQFTASGEQYKIGEKTYPNKGYKDSFIVKMNPQGGFIWAYQFLGTGSKQLRALGVNTFDEVLFGHEYIGNIASEKGHNFESGKDKKTPQGTIGMLTADGKMKWMQPVSSEGFANVRGAGADLYGNSYYTGVITGASTIDKVTVKGFANGSSFLSKYSRDGQHIWTRVLGNNEADTGGELITYGMDKVAITGSNKGNYSVYDRNGKLLQSNIHTVASKESRATLTMFDTNGTVIARHSPIYTDASNAGVLVALGSNCFAYQFSFYGTVKFATAPTFTTTGADPRKDKDSAFAKVCY